MPEPIEVVVDDKKEAPEIEVKDIKEEKKEASFNPEDVKKITEDAIKKATAPLFYEIRQLKQQPKSEPVQKVETPKDEWDERIQKDWKGTIRELAREEAKEIRKAEKEAEAKESEKQKENNLRESNKKKVLERHPELNEADSEKAQVYLKVLNENPDYIYNPFGPVLAMRDMEDKLREEGKLDEPTKKMVEKEVTRQTRASATQAPQGGRNTANKVILSSEEKQYCDRLNMKYEEFAKMKAITNRKDGVTA